MALSCCQDEIIALEGLLLAYGIESDEVTLDSIQYAINTCESGLLERYTSTKLTKQVTNHLIEEVLDLQVFDSHKPFICVQKYCQMMIDQGVKYAPDPDQMNVVHESKDSDGTVSYRRKDVLHREGDQPARVWSNGTQEWWYNGKRHREGDKPAIIWASGAQEWWYNDKLHREGDQPAIIWTSGTQEWWYNGKRHREGDQPARVWSDGKQEWW